MKALKASTIKRLVRLYVTTPIIMSGLITIIALTI